MAQRDLANFVRGGRWINNGSDNKRIRKDDLLPDGWFYGRLYKGNFRGGYQFPQDQNGDKNPIRIKHQKLYDVEFLPVGDPWLGIASAILHRCQENKIEFDFSSRHHLARYLVDIAPERCPVFGYKLSFENGNRQHGFRGNLPSVDRIDPALGYIPGNLQVISFRANAMKSDASPEELRLFAQWVLKR